MDEQTTPSAEPLEVPVPAEPFTEDEREGQGGEGGPKYDGGEIPPAPADMVSDAVEQREAHEDRARWGRRRAGPERPATKSHERTAKRGARRSRSLGSAQSGARAACDEVA